MRFHGTKQNGEFVPSLALTDIRQQFLDKLKDGTMLVEDLKVYRPSKTQKQLGAWFGLFCKIVLVDFEKNGWGTDLLLKSDKPTGNEISEGLLKEYMYSVCPQYDDEHQRLTMSKMDTAQMAQFFDQCRNFASSQWSIFVPEPNPDWNKTVKVTE